MIAIPIICITLLMFTLFMIFACPQLTGSHFPDLFKDLLLTFIGIDGISIGYLSSTVNKGKYKTQEEANSNKAVLFSLNFLTSAIALKIIALILYSIFSMNYFIKYIVSAISAMLIISTIVFLLFLVCGMPAAGFRLPGASHWPRPQGEKYFRKRPRLANS